MGFDQVGDLVFCEHDDGSVHPVPPYPQGSRISADLLESMDKCWRDPDASDILAFTEDCRYLICEYDERHHAFNLSRIP